MEGVMTENDRVLSALADVVNTYVSAVVDSGGVRMTIKFDLPYDADVAEVRRAVSGQVPTGARVVYQTVTWEGSQDPDDISDDEFLAELMDYAATLREASRRPGGSHEADATEGRLPTCA